MESVECFHLKNVKTIEECYVCLSTSSDLKQITGRQRKTVLVFVPELSWEEDNCLLCDVCYQELESLIAFKEKCLYSEELRNELKLSNAQELEEVTKRLSNETLEVEEYTTLQTVENDNRQKLKCEEVDLAEEKCSVQHNDGQTESETSPSAPTDNLDDTHKAALRKKWGNSTRICTYCGKCFKSSEIHRHIKIHQNKRDCVCDLCGKGYNSDTTLRTHKLSVHGDPLKWRHVCPICEKRFPLNATLRVHLRRHLGVKRFFCELCEKGFCSKVELRDHAVTHTDQRSFKCEDCGKDYKHLRNLKMHRKKAHGDQQEKPAKSFMCHVCSKMFGSKRDLQRHEFSHTGKPYKCEHCDMRFTEKWFLRNHMKKRHY